MSIETMKLALEALTFDGFTPQDVTHREVAAKAVETLRTAIQQAESEPVAWAYTLEYGSIIADTKVSLQQLRYPFGVCGADYLRVNSDGPSYVRETPLYAAKKEAT